MRILIAEDDVVSRRVLQAMLLKSGYEVVATADGDEAWDQLKCEDAPPLAILDWMMPGKDGVEVCRLVREFHAKAPRYLILLTAKERTEDVVTGLEAGADDYVLKPFGREELHARIRVGERVLALQMALAERIIELQTALTEVKALQGLLPICAYCKKIRDDHNYWGQIEAYIARHSEARFTHGICPECYEKLVLPELNALKNPEGSAGST
jgi:CheY-like chemotaxis protein